jgi:hypothetical protein
MTGKVAADKKAGTDALMVAVYHRTLFLSESYIMRRKGSEVYGHVCCDL